ncbi:MAG: response regulator transcription factor [Bacteroidales bacterium]|nr:response regulator transcription factor [Bacteroidales bacterium]
MIEQLTVVLVERSFLMRAGIEHLLEELPGLVLLEVFDGTEKKLGEKIMQEKPDLVIVNCAADREVLFSLTKTLRAESEIILVGLASEKTPPNISSRFPHILQADDGKFELLEALQKIIGKRLKKNEAENDPQNLSARELTILKKVAFGLTSQQIADELFLSIHTVMTHRKNITKKLGIKTVSGLTVYALMNKLVEMGEIERGKK